MQVFQCHLRLLLAGLVDVRGDDTILLANFAGSPAKLTDANSLHFPYPADDSGNDVETPLLIWEAVTLPLPFSVP